MGGVKISEFTPTSTLDGNELIPIVQGGLNKRITTFLLNGYAYDIRWFGAVGDGVTNDSAAIQTAITAAIAAGGALYIPKGTFLCTGLTINGALTIFGDGNQSIIKTATNNIIFNITANGFRIFDIKFVGSLTGTSEIAVRLNTVNSYMIGRCTFLSLGGAGISCFGTVVTNSIPSIIQNCYFSSCYTGIKIENRHEYVSLSGNLFWGCTYSALWLLAGNFNVNGGSITKCNLGIYMTSGTNDSHSSISNVSINHNNQGIFLNGIQYGLVFSACQFHANTYLYLLNNKMVLFNGCEFGSNTIRLENCEAHFANSIDLGTNTIVNDYNGNISHTLWTGKTTVGEVNPIFRIQAETDAGSAIVMTNKTGDEKYRLYASGAQKIAQLSGVLTDGVPTDAEIDAITGTTPAAVGAGWKCIIKDTTGTGLLYLIESDGTDWFYSVMSKAL